MSIFGHFNNFFFAAHLLDIAMGFKTLRTILSSVTHNGKQVSASTSRGSQSTSINNFLFFFLRHFTQQSDRITTEENAMLTKITSTKKYSHIYLAYLKKTNQMT
ncbi:hypothetical protein ILYODFUR_036368 [Ilyodon furcidens]|uniref:Uncharacterized protein n=1 Tax=Ilyodon furcidens TaxID=33524 RepID=A0ABV0VMF7_9TELE